MSGLHVIGAGGHAKVIIRTAEAAGLTIRGVYDDSSAPPGHVLGHAVIGRIADLYDHSETEAVIAIGDNASRKRIAHRFKNLSWATLIHPTAWVDSTVEIGPGTVILAGSVIQPSASLGHHVIINTAASVDHDCTISHFVHIAPGVRLAGNVRIEQGAFAGIASAFVPGVQLGAWSIVGAGAVVNNNLPADVTAVGVPARVIKRREAGRHSI